MRLPSQSRPVSRAMLGPEPGARPGALSPSMIPNTPRAMCVTACNNKCMRDPSGIKTPDPFGKPRLV
jgi:hypothetical protein